VSGCEGGRGEGRDYTDFLVGGDATRASFWKVVLFLFLSLLSHVFFFFFGILFFIIRSIPLFLLTTLLRIAQPERSQTTRLSAHVALQTFRGARIHRDIWWWFMWFTCFVDC